MSSGESGAGGGGSFRREELWGEVAPAWGPIDLDREIPRIVDPAAADETLHWGRNYLYSLTIGSGRGEVEVVVKQFRNQGLRDRVRRRLSGSKAEKSWRVAEVLVASGIATPDPVLLLESRLPDGPSHYVTQRVSGTFEARYLFRAINAGTAAELFPEVSVEGFLRALGRLIRRLHEAGVWHRDISIGNLLLRYEEPGDEEPTIFLLDLNRARTGRRLGVIRRSRDLCRLPVLQPENREILLLAYWQERDAGWGFKKGVHRLFQLGFLTRNRLKDLIRAPVRSLKGLLFQRSAYAHIPPAPEGAEARDKAVWDHLSDQPHQHASRAERLKIRLADMGAHVEAAGATLGRLAPVWARYRKLSRELYEEETAWGGVGVAVRPWPLRPEALLRAVDGLGVKHLLIRLHPWQTDHSEEETLARELHGRGYELAFTLPQNRELVNDLARWRAAVEELAVRFTPFGRHFQVGQAINRSKWGIWNYREYIALATSAAEVLRGYDGIEILGPAVIDFEYQATTAVLNMKAPELFFDAVASLLYVDRRGAPENTQLGLDTVDKVVLMRAVAETARNSSSRCWVTEVNWPLWEGPHSPAGRTVSVDEESQADYLARYYLLTLGTGLLERVYWWQLVARGYGLMEPRAEGGLRPRPSYRALAHLASQLQGAGCLGPSPVPTPARLHSFRTSNGATLFVGWSEGEPRRVPLPRPVARATDRDGRTLDLVGAEEVQVTSSPRYFLLA